MLAVRGIFQNGIVLPQQPVEAFDGQNVIITFLDRGNGESAFATQESGWDELLELAETCAIETGISDLGHQHDHYLYGKPKVD